MSNTNEMPAGRELDALIAVKLMGGKVWFRPIQGGYYILMEDPRTSQSALFNESWQPAEYSDITPGTVIGKPPAYSTDITAAWQVLEKLRERFEEIGIHWIERDKEWSVEIYYLDDEGKVGHAHAPTAPLAICRAALVAVESEVANG